MQVWKRRVVALVAAGVGGAGLLMSTAGAQTGPPTTVPSFTIPDFPDFTIPDFTIPDFTIPTLPSTTTPPPTMPPPTTATTTPPPTMPPTTIGRPDIDAEIENLIDRLEQFGDVFAEIIEELQALQARF